MSGYCIVTGTTLLPPDREKLVDSINMAHTMKVDLASSDDPIIGVSYHRSAPLRGSRIYTDDTWTLVLGGDLIEDSVSWDRIRDIFERRRYEDLRFLNGMFSLCAYHRKNQTCTIVSDRRSQYPVFYHIDGKSFCASTEMATFCRLAHPLPLRKEWVWEYLFFSLAIRQGTFLEGVYRMPPASVLEFDIRTGEHRLIPYAPRFTRKPQILEGEQGLEIGYQVYRSRVPKHFRGSNETACALTGGWDGRTNVAFCPDYSAISLYTYGLPGCADIWAAARVARALHLPHRVIEFDQRMEKELPTLIYETLYLSSGIEHALRSSLLYMYRTLTDNGKKFPLVMSGLGHDMQLRGHVGVPHPMSPDMAAVLRSGQKVVDESVWAPRLGSRYGAFRTHILEKLDQLEQDYGNLGTPNAYLSFMVYETDPKRFAGEVAIGKYFSTIRVPAWDNEIIDLAFSIEQSALSYSQFLAGHVRGDMHEMELQASFFIRQGGPLASIPIRGVPPRAFFKGRTYYNLVKKKNLALLTLRNRFIQGNFKPLEEWDRLMKTVLRPELRKLVFSPDARITAYLEKDFIDSLRDCHDYKIVGKLLTLELILRLVEHRWERFWTEGSTGDGRTT
jgi:asparagine synthetase B (glutamine-hydrolysing)